MFLPFVRAHFGDNESCRLPKTLLLIYCRWAKLARWEFKFFHFRQKGLEQPKYMMETVDKQFRASVKVKWSLALSLPVNIHHLYWRWGTIYLGALCWRRTRSMPSRSFKFNTILIQVYFTAFAIFLSTRSQCLLIIISWTGSCSGCRQVPQYHRAEYCLEREGEH